MSAPVRRSLASNGLGGWLSSRLIWMLLLAAAGIAIGIAASTSTSAHESISQEARTIDRSLKCPSCNALSVWQSDAPTAVAVRHSVLHRLEEGQSPKEIKAYMVSRYGEDILLKPPDHGFDSLVWILPIAAAALGALGLGILFVKRAKDQDLLVDEALEGLLSTEPGESEAAHQPTEPDQPGEPHQPEEAHQPDGYNQPGEPRHGGLFESRLVMANVMARGTPERLALEKLSKDQPFDGFVVDTLSSLVHSIEDLEEEHGAGELSEEDFEHLLVRYRGRIQEVLGGGPAGHHTSETRRDSARSLRQSSKSRGYATREYRSTRAKSRASVAMGAPTKAHRSRRTRWIVGTVVLVALLVGGGIAIASRHSQPKLPGRPITGNVSLDRAEQVQRELTQAATLLNQGKDSTALYVYDKVLKLDPHNPAALVGSGWLMRVAGVQEHDSKLARAGRERLEEAVEIDPTSAEARLLWATVLLQDEADPRGAAQQLQAFLRDHPSPGQLEAARQVAIPTYAELHEPLPTGFSSKLN